MIESRQLREAQARDEERARVEAIHNAYPAVQDMPSPRDPSGLVPYPCSHGIAVKPARFPVTKGGTAWRDADGNERPPYGGRSWGRSKFLFIERVGGRDGIPFAVPQCVLCLGQPEPEDFFIAADGSTLR